MVSSITSPSDWQLHVSHVPPSTGGYHKKILNLLFPQKTDYKVSVASDLKEKTPKHY